jgi:two-component system, cell cycle sensor histidine kinase and response regulator CckA
MDERTQDKPSGISLDKKAALQRFITLGELTASISHELKNLLISITGYCDLIQEKCRNKESADADIAEIKKAAQLAQNIFMELLQFSRGAAKDEKTPSSLNKLVEEVLVLMKTAKKVAFQKELAPSLPDIPINTSKIKQVFINILLNATNAVGEKSGTVTVTTSLLPYGFGVAAAIKDTGCGMTPETLKKLFQPFFTTKEKGTGLGLSVCRDIMSEHNGYIHVQSESGQGSTFTLAFLFDRFQPHPDIIDL